MKNSFLKTGNTQTVLSVDKETGEILNEERTVGTYLANAKDSFFFVYFDFLPIVVNLKGPVIKVYFYLLENYKVGSLVGINKAVKDDIKSSIGSRSTRSIGNCLCALCRSNLLIKKGNRSGGYYINPRYAFKGSTAERNKALYTMLLSYPRA
jgi:replication protein RepL